MLVFLLLAGTCMDQLFTQSRQVPMRPDTLSPLRLIRLGPQCNCRQQMLEG